MVIWGEARLSLWTVVECSLSRRGFNGSLSWGESQSGACGLVQAKLARYKYRLSDICTVRNDSCDYRTCGFAAPVFGPTMQVTLWNWTLTGREKAPDFMQSRPRDMQSDLLTSRHV